MPQYLKFYLKLFIALTVATGLSACGSAARKNQPTTGTEQVSVVVDDSANAKSDDKVEKEEQPEEDVEEELAALSYEIAPLEPEVDDDPEKFLGIDAQQLVVLLGDPSLIRRESPAEIWQYSTKSCVLDLVLYDSVTAYIEARDEQVRPMDSRTCLRSLLLSRQNW
ncbi:hypothetical protein A9Q97_03850 [Rhodospirillales bacterium 47_12_T64]|nr:hypothetical protein A9Q97_03850 [Rhodospirillales bacterium 47_12_T64]